MSRINAVRLINVNYNYNACCISDEIMHMNGESTLINLRNGGGKTVMVQLMTAPFVHKKYRNIKDRPFSSFFTSNRPSFILVEWALDWSGGYVLTGMMVRKSQNPDDRNDEELEMVNFISAYREPCLQDIHNLPVHETKLGEKRLKNYQTCRQLFDSYKKDHSIDFRCFDMNNSQQSRQYFDALNEYRINYREWESIIRRVNEEESGLSKLFADCKDEKGLVEKWFLNTIENKLNKDSSLIKGFQEIMEKFIGLYRNNEVSIKRKNNIELFDAEAEKIRVAAERYQDADQTTRGHLQRIAAFLHEMNRLYDIAEQETQNANALIAELEKQIQHVEYSRFSAEYYQHEDELAKVKEKLNEIEVIISELNTKRTEWTHRLHLLVCAKLQEKVDTAYKDKAYAEERLELSRQKNQNLQPEREYLGYILRGFYEDEVIHLQEQIDLSQQEQEELIHRQTGLKERRNALDQAQNQCSSQEGSLNSQLKEFDKQEARYNRDYKPAVARNIVKEYDDGLLSNTLDKLETASMTLKQQRSDSRRRLEYVKKQLDDLERLIRDSESAKSDTSVRLERVKQELSLFETELSDRRKILTYLKLSEDSLFDRDHILKSLGNVLRDLNRKADQLSAQERELKERIQSLRTGKTMDLTPEQQKMFDGLGIEVVYAIKWLKEIGFSEEQKLEMIDKHPFLPYALIMSEREWQSIKKEEKAAFTSFPIPVITRETLASQSVGHFDLQNTNGPDAVHFYLNFNRNLLNEEKLENLIAELEEKAEKAHRDWEKVKEEIQVFTGYLSKISEQKVTQACYQSMLLKVEQTSAELVQIIERIDTARNEKKSLDNEYRKLPETIKDLEIKIKHLQDQSRDLEELIAAYEKYLENRKLLADCEQRIREIQYARKSLSQEETSVDDKILAVKTRILQITSQKEKAQNHLDRFQGYTEVRCPDELDPELKTDMIRASARFEAITRNMSGELAEYENEFQKAVRRWEDARSELHAEYQKHELEYESWKKVSYTRSAESESETEIKELGKTLKEAELKQKQLEKDAATLEERMKHPLSRITETWGYPGPIPREELEVMDYRQKKKNLEYQQSDLRNEAQEKNQRRTLYSSIIEGLSEYQHVALVTPISWTENFSKSNQGELRRFSVNLKNSYQKGKDAITDARELLDKTLNQIMRIEAFKDEFFKRPLVSIESVIEDPEYVLKQLDIIQKSFHSQMEKLLIDIQMVDQNKAEVIQQLENYVSSVHAQMGLIDNNSTIQVRDCSIKMLKINIPDWEMYQNLYTARISDMVDELTAKCVAMLKRNESIHDYIGKRITTRELYDTVIGIGNVHIQLYKIEAQREVQISWSDVAKNSGGEGFLSAFVILSSLLYYMRRDESDNFAKKNEGKVLLMDNPFAQTNAEHLLKPLMELAKKKNTQLICLTGLGGESIYNRFDNIYVLTLQPSSLNNVQYLRGEHKAGREPENLTASHFDVTDDGQMELFF